MLPFSLKPFCLTLGAALLLCGPAMAQSTEFDDKAAVIFTYFAIGNDDNPAGSITTEQFAAQIDELVTGDYIVKPLPEIVTAFLAGKPLPPHTVGLSFDGADKSVINVAFPLLEKNNLPFTVFVPAGKIGSGGALDWNDLQRLQDSPLASFGAQPSAYNRLSGASSDEIKRQINNSISEIRKQMDMNVTMFAYPYGEYDAAYEKIVRDMNFKAAFGQQSGVAYAGDDHFALPRFSQTERYGDLERFQMTANALPLPVKDVSPADPHLSTLMPTIGFTVPDSLSKSLKNISCFSSGDEKPKIEIINTRVELRMNAPITDDRPRINCTLPLAADGGEQRWRWFGALYTVPQDLLDAQELKNEKTIDRHASGASDEISVE